MQRVMVRYKVKPDRVAENEALVRAVYEELAGVGPGELRYETFRLEDGVTFVHIATYEPTADGSAPFSALDAFKRFRAGLEDRCAEGPVRAEMDKVGGYDMLSA
jgi:hypothetical protein